MKKHNLKVGDYVKVTSHTMIRDLSKLPPKIRFGKVIEILVRYSPTDGKRKPDLITFRNADGGHSNTTYMTLEKLEII